MSPLERLEQKITSYSAVVGIIELGYVGLPLNIRFSEAGFKVLGFDIDAAKPPLLNAGRCYISHISDERIAAAVAAGFEATTDFTRARAADVPLLITTQAAPVHCMHRSFIRELGRNERN